MIALFLVTLSASAQAAPLADSFGITRWNISASSPNLTYFIDPSASAITTQINTAFTDWSSFSTSYLTFSLAGSAATANILITVPTSLGVVGASGYSNGATDGSGNLTSCTSNIGSSTVSSGGNFLQTVITHEIGHCLGLAHSVSANAIMSYRSAGLHPNLDDQYALALLYPKSNMGYPAGCATVARPTGPRSHRQQIERIGSDLIVGFMVLGGFLMLRRKTRVPKFD